MDKDPIEVIVLDDATKAPSVYNVDAILKAGLFTSKPSSARLSVSYSNDNKNMFRLGFGDSSLASSQVLRAADLRQVAEVLNALAAKLEQGSK